MKFDFMIHTQQDLTDAVEAFGIVPFFRNEIPGFSIEEHAAPGTWYAESEDFWPIWEWKGPVIRASGCAYGKFFAKKAAFVSREWFLDLANYRRDGYDFDARYDDGLASRKDKDLFDLVEANGPVLSKTLKALGDYRKGGRTGFETSLNRLQERCYILTSDFVYMLDKYGRPYGWGVAEYATPEQFMGEAFTSRVYGHSPEESRERLLSHLGAMLPEVDETALRRFLA